MIKSLMFATANQGKIDEASRILGIKIEPIALEIDEIQSLDPVKVAVVKAQSYWAKIEKALFVEDVSLTVGALKNLPGPYINDFTKALGNDGLANLAQENPAALAQTTLVYITSADQYQVFTGVVEGKIVSPQGTNGFGWDPIFMPVGSTKTFAQMENSEKDVYSMRRLALDKFKDWLDKQV